MAKAGLLFVGTDDGLVLFSNPNNIGRWLRIGHVLRGRAIHMTWPLADNPLVVFAAVSGMGLQRSDDGGQSWQQALDVQIRTVIGSHSGPQTIYLGALDGQVYSSLDAGANWQPCPRGQRPNGVAITQLATAHSDPRRLYAGLANGQIWASPDGGNSWADYRGPLPAAIGGLAVAPDQPDRLYASAAESLYRWASGDQRWEPIDTAQEANSDALAVLAGKQPVLLAGGASSLRRSDDDGATWTTVGTEVEWGGSVTTITLASYHIDTAFAGSGGGRLGASTDRGRTWQLLKHDLPPVRSIAAARLA